MWSSKGWVRTVGIVIGYIGLGMGVVPPLAPYSILVIKLGAVLAGAGVVNAGVSKLIKG